MASNDRQIQTVLLELLNSVIQDQKSHRTLSTDTNNTAHRLTGPAPVLFRSGAYVKRPSVRRPRVISSRGLSVCGVGC
ncbi:hypothetical protein, partial [Pseudorhodobacter sp. E13]|uniref:hypothetical protein n=1 Tax=Pseudorhodobacter sp. E13 TaxID=2487931 RepID=UPI001F1DBBEA